MIEEIIFKVILPLNFIKFKNRMFWDLTAKIIVLYIRIPQFLYFVVEL